MDQFKLSPLLVRACKQIRIVEPTEIQKKSIGLILNKNNVLGVSPTGSGKTAAYSLPILSMLSEDPFGIFSIILLPTKELALQVFEQFYAFSSSLNFQNQILLITGGDSWTKQSLAIASKPYIVVSTPSRLLSHLQQDYSCVHFRNVQTIVLDEADYLINQSVNVIDQIIDSIQSRNIQKLYFTATSTDKLKSYIQSKHNSIIDYSLMISTKVKANTNDPRDIISIDIPYHFTIHNLDQFYIFIPLHVKLAYIVYILLNPLKDKSGIIFTKNCESAQLLCTLLELFRLSVTSLHSLLDHRRRLAHLAKFRNSVSSILVATDLVSRGLDIPHVHFVINFDFPFTFETYIHRIGRAGRSGLRGLALSFITEKDKSENVSVFEEKLGIQLTKYDIIDENVVKLLNKVSKYKQEAKQILIESDFYEKLKYRKSQKSQKSIT